MAGATKNSRGSAWIAANTCGEVIPCSVKN
ncbi:Uncharacterised protein [Vibrio cholerae]|nr:Uncharacterised protein [Vibrio cholerae]